MAVHLSLREGRRGRHGGNRIVSAARSALGPRRELRDGRQGLTLVPNLAQLELFFPPYNPT